MALLTTEHITFSVLHKGCIKDVKTHSTLDVLTADIKSLTDALESGSLRSVDPIDRYVDQIEKHDHYLHAMLSLPSRESLKDFPSKLDHERDVM